MSAIYDIAGTSNDTFMINGKATFIQGAANPENYQGVDGDVYLQSGVNDDPLQVATLWIKRNGSWKDMGSNMLPVSSSDNKDKFLISKGNGEYGFAEIKYIDGAIATEVPAGSEGNALYATMGGNDQFRIRVGGESDAGWVEMATGDNGNEPIYIRQYTGNLNTNPVLKNTFTVLDKNGYTWLAKHPAANSNTDSLQVPSIGWINDSTKSTNLVHRTDEETITDTKTFIGKSERGTDAIVIKNNVGALFDTTNNNYIYMKYKDKEDRVTGWVESLINKPGDENNNPGCATLRLWARTYESATSETGIDSKIDVIATPDGKKYATCPTPCLTSSSGNYSLQIVNVGYLNSSDSNVVHRTGDETIGGTKTFSKTIQGTALKALWADLAEYYEADNDYLAGTLMTFGGDKEVTIATEDCNAVVSTNPALMMNGNHTFEHPCLLALVGRVPVRVIGKVNKFDYLQLSEIPGVARVIPDEDFNFSNVIARALESKDSEEEGLVLCVVKFEL